MLLGSFGGELLAASLGVIASILSPLFSRWRERLLRDETQEEADRLESAIFVISDETDSSTDARSLDDPSQQRFAKLLVQYYAHGLVQARRSFSVSLSYSALGGLVLVTGVGLAIFRAETSGELYASVTASCAGLLTSGISVLFHRRADAALKHLEKQGEKLQQDMKAERDAGQAVRLLGDVDDDALRAHLQAALILKFSAAQLPELDGVQTWSAPLPQRDDVMPQQAPEGHAPSR